MPTLTWDHTELGRRTACGSYRIVRKTYEYCELLDAEWNFLAKCPSIQAAQQLAEQFAARARRRKDVA